MLNRHTTSATQNRKRPVTNDEVIGHFRPIQTLLWEVIEDARELTSTQVASDAFPRLGRRAHLRRISGAARWMHVADGIVDRRGDLPDGYAVESTEEQHNQGQYIFRFPGGIFTVKRTPHKDPDDGKYLQEALEGFQDIALAAGIDADADLLVLLSVGANGEPKLLVEHPTLDKPMTIGLEALRTPAPVEAISPAHREIPQTKARSTRKAPAEGDSRTSATEA